MTHFDHPSPEPDRELPPGPDYAPLFPELPPQNPTGKRFDENAASLRQDSTTMFQDLSTVDGTISTGHTYFGQFLAHDTTYNAAAPSDRINGSREATNLRSRGLDLDSLYGDGPAGSPYLYELDEIDGQLGFFFRLGSAETQDISQNKTEFDLLRRRRTIAVSWENNKVRVLTFDTNGNIIGRQKTIFPRWSCRIRCGGNPIFAVSPTGWIVEQKTNISWRVHPDDLRVVGEDAIIVDPRNDENTMVSQLTLAFQRFHNAVMASVLEERAKNGAHDDATAAFEEARQVVRWHYQWVVLHDYLPRIVGRDLVDSYLVEGELRPDVKLKLDPSLFRKRGKKPRAGCVVSIPLEFSVAAFRFGHAMVRDEYELNRRRPNFRDPPQGAPKGAPPILASTGVRIRSDAPRHLVDPRGDLRGGRELPPRWSLQWDLFLLFEPNKFPGLPIGEANPQLARPIGAKLAPPLSLIRNALDEPRSLAASDLVRGLAAKLPSGEDLAQKMELVNESPLAKENRNTPLWKYILEEAAHDGKGHLGPVGGTLVLETFLALLLSDKGSFVNKKGEPWKPTLEHVETFELSDIIHLSGAPILESELPFVHPTRPPTTPGEVYPSRLWNAELLRSPISPSRSQQSPRELPLRGGAVEKNDQGFEGPG